MIFKRSKLICQGAKLVFFLTKMVYLLTKLGTYVHMSLMIQIIFS